MLFKLLLLFILTPLAELALLVYVGTLIGVWYTILIVVATGVIGAALARHQGLATLRRIRANLEQGIIPSIEIFEGALILVGGLLLLTPGMVTDLIGFSMLLPPTRRSAGRWLFSAIRRRAERGQVQYWGWRRP